MTVYVDAIMQVQPRGKAARYGVLWCHMYTDGPEEELHALAERIGCRRSWFQPDGGRLPHYDLTPGRREAALKAGAKEATRHMTVAIIRQRRQARR